MIIFYSLLSKEIENSKATGLESNKPRKLKPIKLRNRTGYTC